MNALDPRSIISIASLTCGLMALVLYFMRRSYPRRIEGLGYWAIAAVLWCISAILLTLRLSEFSTGVIANGMLLMGALLYYVGCRSFFGLPTRW